MARVFISYRREDSAGSTGRLAEFLRRQLGRDQVFMDIDNIPGGADFVDAIKTSVGSCDSLLAVIGSRWLSVKDAKGQSRLHDADDYIRLEIATALSRNVKVIPVLVDGAEMPKADDLPNDLKSLVRRNAVEITNRRWDYDANSLLGALRERPLKWAAREHRKLVKELIAAILILGLVGVAVYMGKLTDYEAGIRPAYERDQAASPVNSGSDPSSIPNLESQLIGNSGEKFKLDKAIHWGDRATLYLAKTASGKQVVAKIFRRGLKPGSVDSDEFDRELEAARILRHVNIAPIINFGNANGYPFIIMEYFPGRSLQEWLQTHDRMSGPEILSVATQLAEAIDFAHSKGVLHRDIKPSNILLESTPQGHVALSDFGTARVFGAVEMKITAAQNVAIGSPAYLAPETIKGGKLSTASDIYGFGTVLFEMIAGKPPFHDRTEVFSLLHAKTNESPPDIRKFRVGVSSRLSERLIDTLSQSPTKRPQSARSVLSGVEEDIRQL